MWCVVCRWGGVPAGGERKEWLWYDRLSLLFACAPPVAFVCVCVCVCARARVRVFVRVCGTDRNTDGTRNIQKDLSSP